MAARHHKYTGHRSMPPFTRQVGSRYGSPMGRHSDHPEDFDLSRPLNIQRVHLDGDYDEGGAYWGGGRGTSPLYCVWDGEGNVLYMRAPQGVKQVMDVFPEDTEFEVRGTRNTKRG